MVSSSRIASWSHVLPSLRSKIFAQLYDQRLGRPIDFLTRTFLLSKLRNSMEMRYKLSYQDGGKAPWHFRALRQKMLHNNGPKTAFEG